MKNIGLFFGSFNPVHLGHSQLAKYIFEYSGVDEIWYVVSPRNPLKEQNELIDEHIRLKMIQLATEEIEYLQVSDIEFNLPKPSYTINTLTALKEKYPEDEFILMIGSDNMVIFRSMERLRNYFGRLFHPCLSTRRIPLRRL
ncbi:MAG: nicotinate-nucleotide adenylyltransferase [Paludibacteraceae bacterium]